MSRIGRKPIVIPAGVDVKLDGTNISVKGPKGKLDSTIHPIISLDIEDGIINVKRPNDEKQARSLHGLTRSLVANMVEGVSAGFSKTLDIQGVGYRAAMQGNKLVLTLGFSHPVERTETDEIKIEVPAPNRIVISGVDKQKVGQFAAEIREIRPPEPYKGKGIRYLGEFIAKKEGKAGKAK